MKTTIRVSLALLAGMPLIADAQTYFAGTVVDGTNQPLAGATIRAGHVQFPIFPSSFTEDGRATSDAQGHYAMTTLAAGDGSGNYVLIAESAGRIGIEYPGTLCYASCPGTFPPAVAAPNLAANFQLSRPGSISGHVTRADTHAAVSGVFLQAWLQGGSSQHTTSAADGSFTVSDLLPGSYSLEATSQDELLPQMYAGHDYDFTLEQPAGDGIVVQDGQNVAGVDLALHPGAQIEGTVTSSIDGAPLQSRVGIRRLPSEFQGFQSNNFSAPLGGPDAGRYAIGPLTPGSFEIAFGYAAGSTVFAGQYYPDAANEVDAVPVVVTDAQVVSGIDAHLMPLQTISGTVRDADTGQPVAGAVVHAGYPLFISLGDFVDAITDANGTYLLQGVGVSTGQPRYYNYIWVSGYSTYLDTFYPSVAATDCCIQAPSGAQALPLDAGQHITGVDISLSRGAYVHGRVFDADTGYVAPAYLNVDLRDGSGAQMAFVTTDATGNYSLDSVPSGSYYLVLAAGAGRTIYYPDSECTNDCPPSGAQPVLLTAPQTFQFDFAVPHLDLIFRGNFD